MWFSKLRLGWSGLVLAAASILGCQSDLPGLLKRTRTPPEPTSDQPGTPVDPIDGGTSNQMPDVGVDADPGPSPTPTVKTDGGTQCDPDSDMKGCVDSCPDDPQKDAPGSCGCGTPETDSDLDGLADCLDECPMDANKIAPGMCGCDTLEGDTDEDGTANCNDGCPTDPLKTAGGVCGCGSLDVDLDGDKIPDCEDNCPDNDEKLAPGACGCGVADTDTDKDGIADCNDECETNPAKTVPGVCGCESSEADGDSDGVPNCNDSCPADPNKTEPGQCGCGTSEEDTDKDGTLDCNDACATDPDKTTPGSCGCGTSDVDSDNDGTPDCSDPCPDQPGLMGCSCETAACHIANNNLGPNLALESVVAEGDADSTGKFAGTTNGHLRDDNLGTAWAPAGTVPDGSSGNEKWASIKWLGAAQTFSAAILVETGDAVEQFRLENAEGSVLVSGTTIGRGVLLRFDSTESERLKLVIKKASARPYIAEIQVYNEP